MQSSPRMTPSQTKALEVLSSTTDSLDSAQVAARAGISYPVMTSVLRGLADLGHVSILKDGRRHLYSIHQEGK
jgi:predicted transcriptional regulator